MLKREIFARYVGKYGASILDDYKEAITNMDITLTSLAYKYGYSRERSRQLFKIFNGFPYTQFRQNKIIRRAARNMAFKIDPHKRVMRTNGNSAVSAGTKAEAYLFDVCRKLGFNILPVFDKYDFLINNKRVEFKSSSISRKSNVSTRQYYHFGIFTKNEWDNLDFAIYLAVPINTFYIVPRSYLVRNGIFIPDPNGPPQKRKFKPSRFLQFENAWHLLS